MADLSTETRAAPLSMPTADAVAPLDPAPRSTAPGPAPAAAPAAAPAVRREPIWRQVWRSVTPFGRTAVLLGVVSLAIGRFLGWAELAAVAVVCLVGVLIGIVFLLAGQADLAVELALGARRVVAGDPANTRIRTTNRAGRRTLPLRLEARVGRATAHVDLPGLAAGAEHDELIIVPTHRRSVVPVGPVRSVLGDPLGLVRREINWTGTEELFVHPRTVRLRPLTSGWQRDLEGDASNERSPSDVAFHTLREYVAGDDRRHIHWKTTARQVDGSLMVKEFVDTRRSEVAVAVSLRAADWRDPEDLELALSALASVGIRALDDGLDLTCLVGGRALAVRHRHSMLDALARVELGEDDTDLLFTVRRHRDEVRRASIVVLLAGSAPEPAEARRIADEIGARATVVVLRCISGTTSGRRRAAGASLFDLGALDDLPRTLGSAL